MYDAELYDEYGNYIKDPNGFYKDATYRNIRVGAALEGADAFKIDSDKGARYFVAIYSDVGYGRIFNSWIETSENGFYEHVERSRRVAHQNLLQSCQ